MPLDDSGRRKNPQFSRFLFALRKSSLPDQLPLGLAAFTDSVPKPALRLQTADNSVIFHQEAESVRSGSDL
jgi:hypothetical protein